MVAVRDTFRVVKRLSGLSPEVGRFFRSTAWISLVLELVKILPPLLYTRIIDSLVSYDPAVGFTTRLLVILVLGYAAANLSMTALDVLYQRTWETRIRKAEFDITRRTLRKLLALDVSYHEEHGTGASASKIIKGQGRIVDVFWQVSNSLLPVTFQVLLTLAVLLWTRWEVGLLFLVLVPSFILLVVRSARRTQASREEYHQHLDEFAASVTQSVMNVRTVKDFANEEREIERADTQLRKYGEALLRRIRLGLSDKVITSLVLDLTRIGILALSVWLMTQGRITAGSLVLIMTLSEKAFANLIRVYYISMVLQDASPSIDRLDIILNHPVEVRDDPTSRKRVRTGAVSFDDVTFSYKTGKRPALRHVSFRIRPNTTVALVGRSGSGKSTVAKLLLRQSDATSGTVLVDNTPVQAYALKELRSRIAVVSQDVELFNDTVAANIAYGVPDAKRASIIAAARMAHAHDFITALPQGYDTVIGERGVKLSGGQKQRLAIARALLKRPRILIFDEATSSLDAESERRIHEAIVGLGGKLTLILIAHRFATIESADHIVLLENGEVREQGTREQLLRKKGIFAKLRKLQELE